MSNMFMRTFIFIFLCWFCCFHKVHLHLWSLSGMPCAFAWRALAIHSTCTSHLMHFACALGVFRVSSVFRIDILMTFYIRTYCWSISTRSVSKRILQDTPKGPILPRRVYACKCAFRRMREMFVQNSICENNLEVKSV